MELPSNRNRLIALGTAGALVLVAGGFVVGVGRFVVGVLCDPVVGGDGGLVEPVVVGGTVVVTGAGAGLLGAGPT